MHGVRLFVAIVPPPAVLDELEAAVAPLRPQLARACAGPAMPAWHVTLAFLGEVGETGGGGARAPARAGRAPAPEPAGVPGRRRAPSPAPARARVLWTGVSGDHRALAALAASVAAGARRAGAPPPDEGRRFRPHVTLARCREPADVGGLVAALAGYAGAPWTAAEIHLIRSHPGDPGRHAALRDRRHLAPAPPASCRRRRATCSTAPQWRRTVPSGRSPSRRRISPYSRSRCQSAMAR